ncbi:MAG: tetratricopeptide repeat protein, partial [Acidobacteriota bacterium]
MQLGSEVRVVLEPGVSVRLLVRAEADRELRLVASQETVDVSLEVELSDGSASARRFDHPGGRYGRELVLLPATTSLRAVVVRATQRGATTLSLEALTEEPAAAEADWTLGAELWARVLRGGAEAGLRRRTSDAFVRAAAAAGERGDRSLEAVARLAAGTAAMAVAAVDARTQLEAAEGLFASLGDARGRAAANAELGVLAWRTGRLDDADAHHRRALDARRRAGDALGEAESRNNLALVAQMRGRHASAKDGYGRALELARQADARELAAAVVQNLGSLHHERGRL